MSNLERTFRTIEKKASQGRAVALSLTSDTTIQELHQEDMLLCIDSLRSMFEEIEDLTGESYSPLLKLEQEAKATTGQEVKQDPTTRAGAGKIEAVPAAGLPPEKMRVILGEIAAEAVVLESLLLEILQDTNKGSSYAAHALIQKIGFMADLGGHITARGDAESWFLPRAYKAQGLNDQAQEIQQ